jgi:hypothetical protein
MIYKAYGRTAMFCICIFVLKFLVTKGNATHYWLNSLWRTYPPTGVTTRHVMRYVSGYRLCTLEIRARGSVNTKQGYKSLRNVCRDIEAFIGFQIEFTNLYFFNQITQCYQQEISSTALQCRISFHIKLCVTVRWNIRTGIFRSITFNKTHSYHRKQYEMRFMNFVLTF